MGEVLPGRIRGEGRQRNLETCWVYNGRVARTEAGQGESFWRMKTQSRRQVVDLRFQRVQFGEGSEALRGVGSCLEVGPEASLVEVLAHRRHSRK